MPAKKSSSRPRSFWWQRQWSKIFFLFALSVLVILAPGQNIYTLSEFAKGPQVRKLPFDVPDPSPYPVNVTSVFPGEEITATGVVIYDVDSGVYLFRRNENQILAPASTTKILTALVALDAYNLDDVVTVKTLVNEGQDMGLVAGERISVENLLFGVLIQSGNDAAYTLAENYPGGVEEFVDAMNDKARSLHLESSAFTNPVGYDDPGHKMSPIDLVRLASFALTNKVIAKMVAIPQITVSDVTHTYFHPLTNVNQLLGKIPGVGGIKTGWTEEAGENLVTLVERGGHRIIIVVLKSLDRFRDTALLITWVFDNHEWRRLDLDASAP